MIESTVHAFMRLCILVGVVVVGGMAYHLYGPPAGEASALLDRMVRQARSAIEQQMAAAPGSAQTPLSAPPRPVDELSPLPASAFAAAPFAIDAERSMPPLTPLPQASAAWYASSPVSVDEMVQQLKAMGVEGLQLTTWGVGAPLHRVACTAPLPGDSGFVRHFDAIEPNAQLAVARVLDQVQAWRAEQAGALP